MDKTMKVEIDAEIYEMLQALGEQTGRSTEEVVFEWLAHTAPKPRPKVAPEEEEAADARFRQRFGKFRSGNPRSADNERIDADLAKEYGSTHEEES